MNEINTSQLNSLPLNGLSFPRSFESEMRRKTGAQPVVKIEFIDTSGNSTDISDYYVEGADFTQLKERAPDEIQAGNFSIVLSNQDNYFSEYVATSLFYDEQYHNGKIKVSLGFNLPNGTTEYETQAVGIVDELMVNPEESIVTLRCRDRIRKLIDSDLHLRPTAESPAYGTNTGDGACSKIETKPFKTVNEDWTLTCTVAGGDSTAEFSVVGSTSGNVGTATSGTEFSTGNSAGGIKFTIKAGDTNWAVDDSITFSTKQYPEWSTENPGKIIWSILTGYGWDSETQDTWSDFVLDYDHTKTTANEDINYQSFVDSIDALDDLTSSLNIKGYVGYQENAKNAIEALLLIFNGSLYTDGDGKLVLQTWIPTFGDVSIRTFSDEKQISAIGYNRSTEELINYIVGNYKATDNWEFSGESVIYDGVHIDSDSTSISNYGKYPFTINSRYYTTTGSFIENIASRLISKYSSPPLKINFSTGLDGVQSEIGDKIYITEDKYNFSSLQAEIYQVDKRIGTDKKDIIIGARRDKDAGLTYGFLGSSADEGDGISPQAGNYDSATVNDKRFLYIGSGSGDPDYRMF